MCTVKTSFNGKYRIKTSFSGLECDMAGQWTHGLYFHLPMARQNMVLPTCAIHCILPYHTPTHWLIYIYLISSLSDPSVNKLFDKNDKNKKKTKNNLHIATHRFHTLLVSLIHAGGLATFAIVQEPQVSLLKVRSICLCGDISTQHAIHSMKWPFCLWQPT